MEDRVLGRLVTVFEKINTHKIGTWFLDRKCLLEYAVNNRVIDKPQIGIIGCNDKAFEHFCDTFRMKWHLDEKCKSYSEFSVKLEDLPINVRLYYMLDKKLICAPGQIIYDIQKKRDMSMSKWGTWKFQIAYNKWFNPPIPYKFGTILDMEMPNWIHKVKHVKKENLFKVDGFFTETRTKNALELMSLLRGCAITAKMEKYLFLGFGTLLGIAREGDFIPTDKDMDHCVQGEFVTREQEEIFLREIARTRTIQGKVYPKGLYEGRCKTPLRKRDDLRFMWTSCGHKKVHGQKGVKSCIWKWFKHDGYDWHSKGRRWVNVRKFTGYHFNGTEDAIAKGITTGFLNDFTEVNFKGITVNIPKKVGSVLDVWYPGWARPKKGASEKNHVMIIPSWKNKNTWKMV